MFLSTTGPIDPKSMSANPSITSEDGVQKKDCCKDFLKISLLAICIFSIISSLAIPLGLSFGTNIFDRYKTLKILVPIFVPITVTIFWSVVGVAIYGIKKSTLLKSQKGEVSDGLLLKIDGLISILSGNCIDEEIVDENIFKLYLNPIMCILKAFDERNISNSENKLYKDLIEGEFITESISESTETKLTFPEKKTVKDFIDLLESKKEYYFKNEINELERDEENPEIFLPLPILLSNIVTNPSDYIEGCNSNEKEYLLAIPLTNEHIEYVIEICFHTCKTLFKHRLKGEITNEHGDILEGETLHDFLDFLFVKYVPNKAFFASLFHEEDNPDGSFSLFDD